MGRSSRCDFIVNHASISRKHAEVMVAGSGVSVRDLESLNGTFVENRRVQKSPVKRGQVIRFGSVSFVLALEEMEDDLNSQQETDSCRRPRSSVSAGHLPTEEILSEAQCRVFDLLLGGHPEKTIARRLDLSHHTVHNHIRAIFKVFNVHSRSELLSRLLWKDGNPPG